MVFQFDSVPHSPGRQVSPYLAFFADSEPAGLLFESIAEYTIWPKKKKNSFLDLLNLVALFWPKFSSVILFYICLEFTLLWLFQQILSAVPGFMNKWETV